MEYFQKVRICRENLNQTQVDSYHHRTKRKEAYRQNESHYLYFFNFVINRTDRILIRVTRIGTLDMKLIKINL